ncbi:hypothetical protein PIB30_027370 [Stylosanthes scabra]|uniref:RING-type domain-containing protein n=1 Tax=Stylosanthes scabra TaxID=79078 RepID=A0ABU6SAV9_9FABA|nr:hypothetical protein [Stylosanthes scabra]
MSSLFSPLPPPPPPPQPPPSTAAAFATTYLTNLGFGYSIAIALGFLFLFSTIILSSYLCCRALRHSNSNRRRNANDGVVLPRVIFVAENDVENNNQGVGGGNDDVVLGLDQMVINSYPKFEFNGKNNAVNVDSICSICLCEYKDLEMLRMMPECRHCFHVSCLDSWLKLNGSCPVCRNSPMPTPLSTPLQEVVPLSLYAADRRGRT